MFTNDSDELEQFYQRWVEKIVLVLSGSEDFDNGLEEVETYNMTIIKLIL